VAVENKGPQLPRLYTDLAEWFHLLTPPEHYAEEAAFYRETLVRESRRTLRTVLELGSGGGNNASYLKHHFTMTLVDIAEPMLEISRRLNPECEHLRGDMRDIRLGRRFDAVFIHDAISYITTEDDLAKAIQTAYVHCLPGGVALFTPDHTRETFTPSTRHGGTDSGDRGLRYLQWVWDPDLNDSTYIMDMVYLMKNGDNIDCRYDRHIMGLFSNDKWLKLIGDAGFTVGTAEYQLDEDPPVELRVFLGIKPENAE
jgi:SAM-dependent methyltransferase